MGNAFSGAYQTATMPVKLMTTFLTHFKFNTMSLDMIPFVFHLLKQDGFSSAFDFKITKDHIKKHLISKNISLQVVIRIDNFFKKYDVKDGSIVFEEDIRKLLDIAISFFKNDKTVTDEENSTIGADASTTLASPTTASSPPTDQKVEDLRSSDRRSVKVTPFGRVPKATVLRTSTLGSSPPTLEGTSSLCENIVIKEDVEKIEKLVLIKKIFTDLKPHEMQNIVQNIIYILRQMLSKPEEYGLECPDSKPKPNVEQDKSLIQSPKESTRRDVNIPPKTQPNKGGRKRKHSKKYAVRDDVPTRDINRRFGGDAKKRRTRKRLQ